MQDLKPQPQAQELIPTSQLEKGGYSLLIQIHLH